MNLEKLNLEKLSLEELSILLDAVTSGKVCKNNKDKLLITAEINNNIKKKKAAIINRKFNFEEYNIIPAEEKKILYSNHIYNVQDLIEADINRLEYNGSCINQSTREYFMWVRKMYNLGRLVDDNTNLVDFDTDMNNNKTIKKKKLTKTK